MGGDDLTPLHDFSAGGADLIAGVAVFGASGFFGIPELKLVAQGREGQLFNGSLLNGLVIIEVLATVLTVVIGGIA
ncbi:unknown [Firmicutes bacterium CAG:137]|nr:unknown [Firmicutes bacterium CAG:137]